MKKEYLFKVLLSDSSMYVPIDAENIAKARKRFSEHMKSLQFEDEWCLIAVYRQI